MQVKNPGTHQRVVGWDAYVRLFAGATSEIAIGEVSPSYLWDRQSPRLIRERLPDAKIIIVLLDPVDRAYLHYLVDVRFGWQGMPFLETLQADAHQAHKGWGISHLYLELGGYSEQVARYLETFSQDAVTVLLSDDLRQDTHRCVSEVLQFLGVPEAESFGGSQAHNAFAGPRGPLAKFAIRNATVQGAGEALRPCGFTEHGSATPYSLRGEPNRPCQAMRGFSWRNITARIWAAGSSRCSVAVCPGGG